MNSRYFYSASLILVLVLLACSFKQQEKPVDPKLLPGKYYKNIDPQDSIFVYSDLTYKHTYHRTDGTLISQTNTWRYKSDVNHIFFESFLFYNNEHPESGDYNGSWPTKVFVTEDGQVKLRYSESIYYIKATEK